MNMKLRMAICKVGEELSAGTKRGRKARKNSESLGFKIFIRNPLVIIFHVPFFSVIESNVNGPDSRHMAHAR